jgi:plastocyanin
MAQTVTRPLPAAQPEPRTPGVAIAGRLTILGLALYSVAMILAVLATVIGGAGFMTVFFSVSLGVTVVLIALTWRFGAWALVLTALLMLLNLAMSGRFMIEGFRFPASFLDFTISLFSVSGNLIALGGAIVALVARRRHATRSTPTRSERTAFGAFLAVLAALTVLSGVLTLANRESVSAQAKAGALPVRMKATKFEPERLETRTGQPVRLLVRNSDPGVHSFTIEVLATDVTITPGSERLIEIADVPPGEYAYVCKLFGHEATMKGTLAVAP